MPDTPRTDDTLQQAIDEAARVLCKTNRVPAGDVLERECRKDAEALAGAGLLAVPAPAVDREGLTGDVVTEHAIEMSGGGMHVRYQDPEIERIFPLAEWIPAHQRFGGKVWRRRVVVVDDWVEVPKGGGA